MSKVKKPYVKPEITIIPPDSRKHKEILQHLERESRGQRFNFTHINAEIASQKYRRYNQGLKLSVWGLVLFILMFLAGMHIYG